MVQFFILIFVFFAQTVHAQETNTVKKNFPIKYQSDYLPSPYLSVLLRSGAVSSVGSGAPPLSVPTFLIMLEGYVPVKHPKLYLLLQFRSSLPVSVSNPADNMFLPTIVMESYRIGGAVGFGGILSDWRNENGHGWHITMQTGLVLESAVHNPKFSLTTSLGTPTTIVSVGVEVATRFRFNPYRNFGVSLGLDIGYLSSVGGGDPFFVGPESIRPSFYMLSYGFVLGLHF